MSAPPRLLPKPAWTVNNSFSGVEPGIYTVYASSANSMEKAVAVNTVTVEAGRSVTAADMNLAPVGSITGRVILDNSVSNNAGFLVSVASTSYMAMTGSGTVDVPVEPAYRARLSRG